MPLSEAKQPGASQILSREAAAGSWGFAIGPSGRGRITRILIQLPGSWVSPAPAALQTRSSSRRPCRGVGTYNSRPSLRHSFTHSIMEFLALHITPTRVAVVTLGVAVAWAASFISSFVHTFTRTHLRYIPGPKSESFIQGNLARIFKAENSGVHGANPGHAVAETLRDSRSRGVSSDLRRNFCLPWLLQLCVWE